MVKTYKQMVYVISNATLLPVLPVYPYTHNLWYIFLIP